MMVSRGLYDLNFPKGKYIFPILVCVCVVCVWVGWGLFVCVWGGGCECVLIMTAPALGPNPVQPHNRCQEIQIIGKVTLINRAKEPSCPGFDFIIEVQQEDKRK